LPNDSTYHPVARAAESPYRNFSEYSRRRDPHRHVQVCAPRLGPMVPAEEEETGVVGDESARVRIGRSCE
jgi:hypothetical protein